MNRRLLLWFADGSFLKGYIEPRSFSIDKPFFLTDVEGTRINPGCRGVSLNVNPQQIIYWVFD